MSPAHRPSTAVGPAGRGAAPVAPRRQPLLLLPLLLLPLGGLGLAGCGSGGDDKEDEGEGEASPPEITHTPGEGELLAGEVLAIEATVRDPDGVAEVLCYFRTSGATFWDVVVLEKGEAGLWSGELPRLNAPAVEYYLRATDLPGAAAELPTEGDAGPFVRAVRPLSAGLPWTEGFEIGDGRSSLFTMGWQTPSEGFNFYQFTLSTSRAAAGAASAFHARGSAEGDEMIDWLISPPLDFTTLDQIMVTWAESGAATANAGSHGLYISTTSPDPAAFEPVVEALPLPSESAFGRSAIYDLSAWAGNPTVYLGWRYQAQNGDDWYIDEVRVEQLAAELEPTFSSTPEEVEPGDVVTLRWDLENTTGAPATGWVASVELPAGGGVVDPTSQDIPEVAGGATVPVEFSLTLDPDQPSDRYLPVRLIITDGDRSWTYDERLLLGQGSAAEIELNLDLAAGALIELGVGDPNAPDLLLPVHAGLVEVGPQVFRVDLTEHVDLLPPAPGPDRWFARVETAATGSFTALRIDAAGALYSAGPATLSGAAVTLQVPPPPVPAVSSFSPRSARPGDAGLPVSAVLLNTGAVSSGPVTADLVSTHPDLTVSFGETLLLDPDLWEAGEPLVISGPTLDVAATHADSTPVTLSIDLDDGLESWSLPVSINVPWPVLRVTAMEIRDSGGDGKLDPGETATIDVSLTNTGGLPTDGRVEVSAALSGDASATLTDATDTAGLIGLGSTVLVDFGVGSVSGAAGDVLNLELSVTDDSQTYQAIAPVVLGEPPWTALTTTDDPAGDNLLGHANDIARGEYRFIDGELAIRLTAHAPIDPDTLFIEAWGLSSGAPYTYYRWVLQAGTLRVQGYDGSWTTLTTGTVEMPSPEVVEMRFPTAPLGLILDVLAIGFAAGWCGPPTYYCDQYPDGWGYPYDAFSTGEWFDLRW